MKIYTISRNGNGDLQLICQAEVVDRDSRGRPIGSHIETEIPIGPFEIGNSSIKATALSLAIMDHYYGASDKDPAATAEAERNVKRFQESFLLHANLLPGAKIEIDSNVIDRYFAIS